VCPRRRDSVDVQRIYDQPDEYGYRVLVDRLWPRGVSKQAAALDEWCKDIAPSSELRRWYGHDPVRFAEFRRRYRAELRHAPARVQVERLWSIADKGFVLLLTATADVEHSGAHVLREYLLNAGH
jgi:uncharacterized protein YeaO (DUF488 family)